MFKILLIIQDIREDLGIHHIVVNDWDRGVDADQNVVLISIPSVLSPDLAPPGKHVLHAYLPGTEPFDLWKGLDRKSSAYKELKAERSEVRAYAFLSFDVFILQLLKLLKQVQSSCELTATFSFVEFKEDRTREYIVQPYKNRKNQT